MSDAAEQVWRSKTDDEVIEASRNLSEYTEKGKRIIREEMIRRGLPEPAPAEPGPGETHEPRNVDAGPEDVPQPYEPHREPPGTSVAYRVFRGTLSTWEALFQEAADFASTLPAGRLIGISHSADHSDGVVAVWYHQDVGCPRCGADLAGADGCASCGWPDAERSPQEKADVEPPEGGGPDSTVCLRCGAVMPPGRDTCPACGWTYR